MLRATTLLCLLPLPFLCTALARSQDTPPLPAAERVQRVRGFVRAFNERDFDALAELAHPEVQWLSVGGSDLSVVTDGDLALYESLEAYAEGCPTCRSELEWVQVAGSRVVTFERAIWGEPAAQQAQSSVALYEFEEGLVRRVYYFPAESVAAEQAKQDGSPR